MSSVPADNDSQVALYDIFKRLRQHYEIPSLVVVITFMLWVRLQAMSNFIVDDKIYYAGNDAYYHFREVNYVVRHWPFTMPFDPWTFFPYGTTQGQFGTLFDQLIATAALIIGLGSPSQQLVGKVVLVSPVVFGSLVAVPTYYLAERLAGRRAGVTAAVLLMLIPGTFLQRSLVGFADHNIAEVLFHSVSILAMIFAIRAVERDQPVYELLVDRDWEALWHPLKYSVIAGVGLFLYVLLWPPAVVLVGIIGVFYVIAIALHTYRGLSPEPLAASGTVSMAVLVILLIPVFDTASFSATQLSLLQLLLPLGVGFVCLFLAVLARLWDNWDIDTRVYPIAVGLLASVGFTAMAVFLPDLYNSLVNNFLRTFAFGQTDTVLTIAEAQSIPFDSAGEYLYRQYGLLFLTMVVGIGGLALSIATSRNYDPVQLLVVIWAIALTMMAFTQVRFNYYLAVAVAIISAWVVDLFLEWIALPTDIRDIESYQVLALLAAFVIVLAPLLPPLATAHVVAVGQSNGPGAVVTWSESLDWIEDNTPMEGQYGDASNELAYYGTYERTDDFAYPEGSYGVMSWWDYGHWITVEGERIPNANPFQQGPRPASAFLLAENETRAELLLEALPSGPTEPPLHDMSDDQLSSTIDTQSPQQAAEDTRFVMIDDQMAAGKFGAIATWSGPGQQVYFSREQTQVGNSQANLIVRNDRFGDTMLARLYFGDASGLSHYRLVHETNQTSSIVSIARQTQRGWTSDLNGDGRAGDYVNRRLSSRVFAAVRQNPQLAFYDVRQAATVKTFERVPGATLTGQVDTDNATTVFATLQLRTNTGRNVTYVTSAQTDDAGTFSVTVPYATNDAVQPADGGTDSAVEAEGDYQLFVGNPFQPAATGNASVPETAVYGGDTIEVTLEPVERPDLNGTNAANSSSLDGETSLEHAPSRGDRYTSPSTTTGLVTPEAGPRVAVDA